MKPKNRVFCPDCGRQKMLFETERKAQDFLRWNSDEIHNGELLHPYYCHACCGWHLSHVEHREEYDSRMDERISMYRESKSGQKWQRKIERLRQKPDPNKKKQNYRKIKNPDLMIDARYSSEPVKKRVKKH